MPPRKSKLKKIDPDLLPESVTKEGPHEPLVKYFTEEEPPKELFEQWADFYEKKPHVAIRELITVILFIGSSVEIEIDDKEFKKNLTSEVEEQFTEKLKEVESDTPIDDFFKGANEKAYDFWTELSNSLIVSKGLFLDEFDDFLKNWVFTFCESNDRTLRRSATVTVCSIIKFLADSVNTSNTELEKLKKGSKSKSSKTSVVNHQIESFETELDNSRSLAMELFTSVMKPRLRDKDDKIREICIKTMGEISILAPEDFGDNNFIKLLGNALTDESPRNRKQAIKQMEAILSNNSDASDSSQYKAFFKSYSPTLVKICNDTDNTLSISVFKLMTKMHKKKLFFCSGEDVEPIFKLTGDDAVNVRNQAAKFFTNFVFNGTLLEDEELKGSKQKNKQIVNEAQLNKFASLASDFSESELTNSIEAFSPLLECLQNWDLISEIILSPDYKKERNLFARILSISASFVSEDEVSDLTVAMVAHLQKQKDQGLLELFKKNNTELTYLTQILQYMDITTLSGASHERQFKMLLEKLHNLFKSNNSKPVYMNIINGIYQWTKAKKKKSNLSKLANAELDNIAKDFSSLKGADKTKLDKFLAVATFHDFSKNTKLRDYLKEITDTEDSEEETNDENISAIALKCLETLYIWDIKRLKDKDEKDKTEYFAEFDSLQRIFIQNLNSPALDIKTAAFCALGSLLSLAKFVVEENDINTECFEPFIYTYHKLGKNQVTSFKSLIRPILSRVIPLKYAVHAFWYLQDDEIKLYVRDFMKDISDEDYPINGSEIGKLMKYMIDEEANGNIDTFLKPPRITKLKAFIRAIATKINAGDAIYSYIVDNKGAEELVPVYAPLFENMNFSDAEYVKPSAEGKVLTIINKILSGKKLKAKDFVVVVKKSKESNDDEYDDEAESEGTD